MPDLFGFLTELRKEWPAVKAAKWAILVAILGGGGIGFGIATLWWSGTVSTLRERLAFAQDKLQIALATPANPAALLTKEAGRHLSEKDRKCLVEQFRDANKEIPAIAITAFPDDEAKRYASEFANLFLRMGYKTGVIEGGPNEMGEVGVMVGLMNPDKPTAAASKFIELIGKCNLVTQKPIKFNLPTMPLLLPEVAALEFDLFVGPKD